MKRYRRAVCIALGALAALVLLRPFVVPRIFASLIVGRVNLPRSTTPDRAYRTLTFRSGDTELSGWLFEPVGKARALVVHLHARMYTKIGGIPTADVLVPRGYAVFAYDQRAHGSSGGQYCTYGKLEKEDLARAIDAVGISPVYVVGHSYGAAVALQAAAEDHRIRAVVAAASYADLRSAIAARSPGWPLVTPSMLAQAEVLAEETAGFRIDDVSPLEAAKRVDVPVLLVHGALDASTPPADSQRLGEALHGNGRVYIVPGADHEEILDTPSAPVWTEIAAFLEDVAGAG